jgi:hypothetical protein
MPDKTVPPRRFGKAMQEGHVPRDERLVRYRRRETRSTSLPQRKASVELAGGLFPTTTAGFGGLEIDI